MPKGRRLWADGLNKLNPKSQPASYYYLVIPFLILAGVISWQQWRISRPDAALETARRYLKDQFPGVQWELGKITLVGEGLGKKWRMEFSSSARDERRIQANLLVNRWFPGKIVGKFVLLLGPPQILDGGWNQPTFLERLGAKISRTNFFLMGLFLLASQSLWLYRIYCREELRKFDSLVLTFLGALLLLTLMVLEVHPGFTVAYTIAFTLLFLAAAKGGGKGSALGERK